MFGFGFVGACCWCFVVVGGRVCCCVSLGGSCFLLVVLVVGLRRWLCLFVQAGLFVSPVLCKFPCAWWFELVGVLEFSFLWSL